MALRPVVTHGVSEYGSVFVETGGRYGAVDSRESLQSLFGVFVPETESSIGTSRAESPIDRMECNRVDGVDMRF